MFLTRLKFAAAVLVAVAVTGLGAGVLAHRALAARPAAAAALPEQREERGQRDEAAPSLFGKVVAVSNDGKALTVETAPMGRGGEEAKRSEVRLTDKTELTYRGGIDPNGARPTVGYYARVWLQPGAKDVAAKVHFTITDGPPALTSRVVKAANDGKVITLETAPANPRTGGEAKTADFRIFDKAEVTYRGVGLNGAKPTEGYQATIWVQPGAPDVIVKANFVVVESSRQGRGFLSGKVAGVSKDGKEITLELPPDRSGQARQAVVKLTDKSVLTFAYTGKEGAKPSAGYLAEVWLEPDTSDVVARARFVNVDKEKAAQVNGKVVAVGKDGFTLDVPPQVRGEEGKKVEIKITVETDFSFSGVGPDEAKVAEGQGARVWLKEGTTDTAARVMIFKSGGRDGRER
jgi:hypothetical protein